MRQDRMRVFHKAIIASLCCTVLAGCGHKTDPVYVPDKQSETMEGKSVSLKGEENYERKV